MQRPAGTLGPVDHSDAGESEPTGEGDPGDTEPVTALARWRRNTASGALLTAVGVGLREVFEPHRDEVAIVHEAPGEPPGDQEVELHFDPDHPERTWAVIRTWAEDPDPDNEDD